VAVAVVLGNRPHATTKVGPETAARIRLAAEQLGYRPNLVARQLAGARSDAIGVLVSALGAKYDYVRIGRLVAEIEGRAYRKRLRIIVGHFADPDHLREYVADFEDRGLDGTICLNHEALGLPPEVIPKVVGELENVVFLNQPMGLKKARYVQLDYGAGARQAAEHLAGRGRKAIGQIVFSQDFGAMTRRHQGYLEGLANAGQKPRPELTWAGPGEVHPLPALISAAIDQVIVRGKADAVLASNDRWAVELMRALATRGIRVPEDVAIVGYNNQDLGEFTQPTLTSIDLADDSVAEALVDLISEGLVRGEEELAGERASRTVPTRLVVRTSA
jgi:DNA-binding LacI/PurR family transcriptional regulator